MSADPAETSAASPDRAPPEQVAEPGGPAWRLSPGSGLAGGTVVEGDGRWSADGEGSLQLEAGRQQWHAVTWPKEAASLVGREEVVVTVEVEGEARGAGLSMGPFHDYLVPVSQSARARRLALEVSPSGRPVLRVDGRHADGWWGRPAPPAEQWRLSLKAWSPGLVRFGRPEVHRLAAPCRVSIVMTCHRFLQRLRVTLAAWCEQDAPTGSYEIIVVNPDSPDGTHEHLAAIAASYPRVRVREVRLPGPVHKPSLIDAAARLCQGEWVWLTDADCLFSRQAVSQVLAALPPPGADPEASRLLLYARRQHLSRADTERLLAMDLDGRRDFGLLTQRSAGRAADDYPWGYTQIVTRDLLVQHGYGQHRSAFGHSDGAFVEACRRAGVVERRVGGMTCLHLDHPFSWEGTDGYC